MMKWNDLEKPWQIALELAWESFKSGSLPIAALIVDMGGNVVSTGRNRILEGQLKNRNMAHAEMDALMNFDYDAHPEVRSYCMYTTLEPCPMCMGTIVMSDVRRVRIATRDPWAGAVDMCQLPYVASKNMDVAFEEGIMPRILTVLYLYKLWEGYANRVRSKDFLVVLEEHFPVETALARDLLDKNVLRKFADDGVKIEDVYNHIQNHIEGK